MAKKDLQEQAKKLGLAFTTKTTVPELEALIAGAQSSTPKPASKKEKFASDEQPGNTPEAEREAMREGHRQRLLDRLAEQAQAAANRAVDQARAEGKL